MDTVDQIISTAIFTDGFEGYSDEYVEEWWEAVQDNPAPRCAVHHD